MKATRLARRLPLLLCVAAGLLAVGGLTPVVIDRAGDDSTPAAGSAPNPRTAIEAAQTRLRDVPGDWNTWARLGSAYVEQARITGDPSYYPRAEGALNRSLQLSPENWAALVGLGSLANARHDFRTARDWGRRAELANPAAGSVHGVIADALTQLGDADGARAETQRMLDVEPGVASFTRASYDFELHGQVDEARDALQRALEDSSTPADRGFCHYYLGELAFNNGEPRAALTEFDAGLTADPDYPLLHAGRAKAYLALGRANEALTEYDTVVQRLPLPNLIAEYGDALTAAGLTAEARRQYDLHDTQQKLFTAAGVNDRLGDAVYLADHGRPAEALSAARTEWTQRQPVLLADALAWALHRNGQDAEALQYAQRATALGWRSATLLYHRGAIQHALGNDIQARQDLAAALKLNPSFDVLQAQPARQLLDLIGARP